MSDDPGNDDGLSMGGRALAVALALVAVGAVAWLVIRAQSAPGSVRPVIWDREACAECKMAISDPAFAAQLQTVDGRVLDFDDPGCLMRYQAQERPKVAALYFHSHRGETWLTRDKVAFLSGVHSPMGFDFGAVPLETPGASSFEQASAKMLASGPDREGH